MPLGDRLRRRGDRDRRLVHSGEEFDSDELERGEIELELLEPTPEPLEDEQAEPWNAREGDSRFRDQLRKYKEFLEQRGGYGE
jgi:hypothetical protein